jgi:hypothetical protein
MMMQNAIFSSIVALPARRDAPSFLEALLVAVERLTMQSSARDEDAKK